MLTIAQYRADFGKLGAPITDGRVQRALDTAAYDIARLYGPELPDAERASHRLEAKWRWDFKRILNFSHQVDTVDNIFFGAVEFSNRYWLLRDRAIHLWPEFLHRNFNAYFPIELWLVAGLAPLYMGERFSITAKYLPALQPWRDEMQGQLVDILLSYSAYTTSGANLQRLPMQEAYNERLYAEYWQLPNGGNPPFEITKVDAQ